MSQKHSFMQSTQTVPWALMSDKLYHAPEQKCITWADGGFSIAARSRVPPHGDDAGRGCGKTRRQIDHFLCSLCPRSFGALPVEAAVVRFWRD